MKFLCSIPGAPALRRGAEIDFDYLRLVSDSEQFVIEMVDSDEQCGETVIGSLHFNKDEMDVLVELVVAFKEKNEKT